MNFNLKSLKNRADQFSIWYTLKNFYRPQNLLPVSRKESMT